MFNYAFKEKNYLNLHNGIIKDLGAYNGNFLYLSPENFSDELLENMTSMLIHREDGKYHFSKLGSNPASYFSQNLIGKVLADLSTAQKTKVYEIAAINKLRNDSRYRLLVEEYFEIGDGLKILLLLIHPKNTTLSEVDP